MIDLYKEAGTSPWGACLPLIIQLLVLVLLYRVFNIGLSTARFDLLYKFMPRPDSINTFFLGINLSKPNLWVLPILAGALQFVQSRLAMPPTNRKKGSVEDNPMMAATSQMMYIFPLVTVFIARGLPAALAIYWITTSAFMIIQQYYINQVIKPRVREQLAHLTPAEIISTEVTESGVVPAESAKEVKSAGKGVSVTIRKKS
jgi:YidC/Oxa1 family membrane protein insertase